MVLSDPPPLAAGFASALAEAAADAGAEAAGFAEAGAGAAEALAGAKLVGAALAPQAASSSARDARTKEGPNFRRIPAGIIRPARGVLVYAQHQAEVPVHGHVTRTERSPDQGGPRHTHGQPAAALLAAGWRGRGAGAGP